MMKVNNKKVKKPPRSKVTSKVTKLSKKSPRKFQVAKAGNRLSPYAQCRLSPFEAVGRSTGIPDGSTNRRLLVDHRMTVTMTVGGTGTLCFMVVPSVPSPVWVLSNDPANVINGITTSTGAFVSNLMLPVALPEWYNLPVLHKATAGNLDDAVPLYASSKFRLVTCGWDLKFLGTTMNDSGVIAVTSVDATVNKIGPNSTTFTQYAVNSGGSNTNYSAEQVLLLEYNSPAFNASNWGVTLDQGSVVVPLRRGAHGVLRHSGPSYSYSDLSNNLQFLSNTANQTYGSLCQTWTGSTPVIMGECGNVSGYDNNWGSTMFRVSGMQNGQSIMLDLVMCIEYVPQPTGSTYALSKAGPKENLNDIRKVDQMAKDMPIAQSGSILDTLDSVVKVGKIVGGLVL